jgi:mRNA interferase MazF
VVARAFVPDAGDVVWINFTPQVAHEQAGRRPAVVLSRRIYNLKAGLAILCPVTSQVKNYPFEVELPAGSRIRGVILADQLKSLDWRQRRVEKFGKIPPAVLDQVRKRVAALIGLL